MADRESHWLADQLTYLGELAARRNTEGESREAFVTAISAFTEAVAERRGVSACVVGHEGLVIASAGHTSNQEGLAAYSQTCLTTAALSASSLPIGELQQMLVVGSTQKIALFQIGEMTLAIQASTGVDLARSLAES